MKLVVTGSTGLLGSALLDACRAQEIEVVPLVRSPEAPGQQWQLGQPLKAEWLQGADAFIHLAAYIPPNLNDVSFAEPCFRLNAAETGALVEQCVAAGVSRFVYAGAALAYGPGEIPAAEEEALYPVARAPYYLSSKVAGEFVAAFYGAKGAIQTTSLRISSIYAPGMKKGGLMPNFARAAKRGETLRLDGGGTYAADFVLASDVATAILSSVRLAKDGAFNIGGSYATTLELARRFVALAGGGEEQLEIVPATGPSGPGIRPISIEKARRELGYEPTPLDRALQSMLDAVP